MEFIVKLDDFDGPLDLMLHLIKENKLDIFNLNMHVLASQYIAFIQSMKQMHLDVASEYIEELTGLMEYKSKALLPRNEAELEENYEQDQRNKLVSRLLEYQMYKEAGSKLAELYENRSQMLGRDKAEIAASFSRVQEVEPEDGFSAYELSKAMQHVLRRHAILQPYETRVSVRKISIEEKLEQILELTDHEKMSFDAIASGCHSLHEVIVSFLAILNAIHEGLIQYEIKDDHIYIERRKSA